MSRHWSEYKYISSDHLWSAIDELSQTMDMLQQHEGVESSELCKLLILGRREMLDAIAGKLHDNETPLGEIVQNHCILTEEEMKERLKGDC